MSQAGVESDPSPHQESLPDERSSKTQPGSSSGDAVLPFEDLQAPEPLDPEPPAYARWLAFGGILLGALLGGMIGYGAADLLDFSSWVVALAGVLFAVGGAVGVGVIAQLTLRAMNEWSAVKHPEDTRR